jgi:hypothetical protein
LPRCGRGVDWQWRSHGKVQKGCEA